jgi:hypothetical protein
MKEIKILLCDINKSDSFPDADEIESNFPDARVVITDTIQNGIAEINTGQFGVVIIGNSLSEKEQEYLEYALHYLNHKPAIVIFGKFDKGTYKLKNSLARICLFHSDNLKSKNSIILIIDAALKKYELLRENQKLRDIIRKSNAGRNIIDLTLSYNHEINNLLTLISGQAQLLIKNDNLDESKIKNKLVNIEQNTKKIRELAIKLTDTINAASDNQINKTHKVNLY